MAMRLAPMGQVLRRSQEVVEIDPTESYKQITVRLHHRGVVLRGIQQGSAIGSTRQFRARKGQLILSRIDARNGAIGLVPNELDGAVVTNDFWLFDVDESQVMPAFLDRYVGTRTFIELCRQASEGTTNRVRLQPDAFLSLNVPLPPLSDQRRIVARVDALAAKIEEAQQLRRAAVSESDLASGLALSAFLNRYDDTPRFTIDEVAEIRGGIQKGPHRTPVSNPVRYLTVAHVQRDHISTDDPRYFELRPTELERWRLLPGDVLIIEGNGSANQIGRTALFRGEIEDCVHQNHVIRIRPNRDVVEPEFLNLYLNSPPGQSEVQALSRSTSGLRTLSVGRIKNIPVPAIRVSEQREIVVHFEDVQAKVNALKRLQTDTSTELDALLPAILDRAFRGEL